MTAFITRALGLNSIVIYALGLLLLGGSIWGYGSYKFYLGKIEGGHTEQVKWLNKMAELRAENERKRRVAQAEIDRIEAETLSQQKRADEAEAKLEEDLANEKAAADTVALPRGLSKHIAPIGK